MGPAQERVSNEGPVQASVVEVERVETGQMCWTLEEQWPRRQEGRRPH